MAYSPNNQLWLQSWRDDRADFHQTSVNRLLIQFWSKLNLPKTSRVFVPLCGKSLDMLWLAQQGHQVIAIELSPIAIRDFFQENGLQVVKTYTKKFTIWRHGNISIFCGDYFSLSSKDLGNIDMVYDRAALTALPEQQRKNYVAHLNQIISKHTRIFLLTTEDAEAHETIAQALGVGDEIRALYTNIFDINLTHVESLYEQDPPIRVEYKLYQLCRKLNIEL